jgi:acetoin utilization deacetylase AcuC-like enzyme
VFNDIAVSAAYAMEAYGLQRVLVIDVRAKCSAMQPG